MQENSKPETTNASTDTASTTSISMRSQNHINQPQTNTQDQKFHHITMESKDESIDEEVPKTHSSETGHQVNESYAMETDHNVESSGPVRPQLSGTASIEVVNMETNKDDKKEISSGTESPLSPQIPETVVTRMMTETKRIVSPDAMEVESEISRGDCLDQDSNTDAYVGAIDNPSVGKRVEQPGNPRDNSPGHFDNVRNSDSKANTLEDPSEGRRVVHPEIPQDGSSDQHGKELNTNTDVDTPENPIEKIRESQPGNSRVDPKDQGIISETSNVVASDKLNENIRDDQAEIPRDDPQDGTNNVEDPNIKETENSNECMRDEQSGNSLDDKSSKADKQPKTGSPSLNPSNVQQEHQERIPSDGDMAVSMETEPSINITAADNTEHLNSESIHS